MKLHIGIWRKKVIDIINNILNIKCDTNNIECVRRLGKKEGKIRPIVITLTTMGLKIRIQKNKKKLESTPYYIKEDFPLEVLNKRKELQKEVNKERENGRLAIIKYDKIVILKNRNHQPQKPSSDNKKRVLPESPEALGPVNTHNKELQPTKINKTNNMDNYLLKKANLQFNSHKNTGIHPQEPPALQ